MNIIFNHNIDPILFILGPLEIRYYGLLFGLAAVMGLFFHRYLFKIKNYDIKLVDDYMIYLLIGAVLGARIIHILFYNPSYYFSNPIAIFKIWEGGIASHGTAIGGIIAALLFVRRKNITFYQAADMTAIPTALATMFIRLGNFINSEIVGRVTDSTWGVVFKKYNFPRDTFQYYKTQFLENDLFQSMVKKYYSISKEPSTLSDAQLHEYLSELPRHPTQIYEMINGLIVFGILFYLFKRKRDKLADGVLMYTFFIFYFILRFCVEFVKEYQTLTMDQSVLTMGQYLSIPFALFGIVMVYYLQKKKV